MTCIKLCFSLDLKNTYRLQKIWILDPVNSKSKSALCACRPCIFFNFQKLQFLKIGKFFSHFKSMATLAEAGAEMLLLEAWHVSVAPKSSRLTWGTDRVFWTVCPNVFSKLESIKWLSRHQVTWGMGSPKNRKRKKNSHFIERKTSNSCLTTYAWPWVFSRN